MGEEKQNYRKTAYCNNCENCRSSYSKPKDGRFCMLFNDDVLSDYVCDSWVRDYNDE